MRSTRPLLRSLTLLIATVLAVPLVALLGAAPASAAPTAVTGSVEDPLEGPLAAVTVEPRDLVTNSPVAGKSVLTDGSGGYTLSLEPGDYRIWFVKNGYTSEPYGGAAEPITVTVAGDGTLVLDGDPQSDQSLGTVTLQATATRTVTGTVTAGGSAYAHVAVRAFAEDDDENVVASTTTDGDGGYTLDLPLGRYYVELVAPIASPQYANSWVGGAPTLQTVPAGDGALVLPPQDLVLATGQSFPVAGTALDANGEGVNDLTVAVTLVGASTPTATTTTVGADNAAGGYSVDVPPGNYNVQFSGAGFVATGYPGAGVTPSTVTVAPNGSLSVNGTPAPSGRLDDTEIPSTGRDVSGTITSSGGVGIAGITVRATRAGGEGNPVTTTTGADGAYTLLVPVGRWTVDAADNSATPQYAAAAVAGGQVLRVDQDDTFSLDGVPATVLPPQALSGVTDNTLYQVLGDLVDANGDPVAGITVTATGTMTATATPNAAGRYALALRKGTYRIATTATANFAGASYTHDTTGAVDVVVAAGGAVSVAGVELPGHLLKPLDLAGLKSTNVTGRAMTTGTPPIAIAGITAKGLLAFDTSVVGGTSGPTAANGTYTLPLKIGTYVIELTDTNGLTPTYSKVYVGGTTDLEAATEVKVAQGGVVSVNGTVLTGGLPDTAMSQATGATEYDVRGTVLDVNGDPLVNVTVTAPGRASVTTDNEGRYTLKLTPEQGPYSPITFSKSEFTTRNLPMADDDDGIGTVTVALDGTITVSNSEGPASVVPELGDTELVGTTTYPVAGTVRGAGNVNPGVITVQVADDNAGTPFATAATTSAAGAYGFGRNVGTYKIQFVDDDPAAPLYARTTLVQKLKVAPGGSLFLDDVLVTTLTGPELAIVPADATYDLIGTASDWDGNSLNGVLVEAVDAASGQTRHSTTTTSDPPGNDSLGDGVYRMKVRPGAYWLRFSKAGYETTYLTSFEDPRIRLIVTVTADGRISAPEEDIVDTDNVITDVTVYDPAPQMRSAPGLKGKPVVGGTVTANLGSWAGVDLKDWAVVEWYLDGKPADKYSSGKLSETFEVPASAVGQRLTFDLTLDDPDFRKASVYFTSKAAEVKALKPKVKASYAKGLVTVKVKAKGIKRLTGKISVLDGKKKVGKGALTTKSKGGVVVIKVARLKPGKHTLSVVFTGGKGIKVVKDKVKVTIR